MTEPQTEPDPDPMVQLVAEKIRYLVPLNPAHQNAEDVARVAVRALGEAGYLRDPA